MGVVLDELRGILAKSVAESGLVLWFDPEEHYEAALGGLDLADTAFLRFDGSYYRLREVAEPFIRGPLPPKLLIYLPVAMETARLPLAELVALGRLLYPGERGAGNTRLSVIARRALKEKLGAARVAGLDVQIAEGKVTFADLERMGEENGPSALPAGLSVIFGTSSPDEAALDFLSKPERDAAIVAKNSLADWASVLVTHFDAAVHPDQSLPEMRSALARRVLIAEMVEAAGQDLPSPLAGLSRTGDAGSRQRCAALARAWRNSRNSSSGYAGAAAMVESELRLDAESFNDAALQRVTTFRGLEVAWMRRVARMVAANSGGDTTLDLARARLDGFWATLDAELKAQWALVLNAGELLACAGEIDAELRKSPEAISIAAAYTRPERGWDRLDGMQRKLEQRASDLDLALPDLAAELIDARNAARRRYAEVAGRMAESFLQSWRQQRFGMSGWYRQGQVFEVFVEPRLRQHRTAYLLVDALRFEMGRELAELLSRDFEVELHAVLGAAPSVTEVGMAALLPRGDRLRVEGGNGLEVFIGDRRLRNRQDRMGYLGELAGASFTELRLEDLPRPRRRKKAAGGEPALTVVTSQEIDVSGETGASFARDQMSLVLRHLVLAIRRLAGDGVERFVIAADHGFIFGDELSESEKIDAPGGSTVLLHRRVWVGTGGAGSESVLRVPLASLGVESSLELATPWNLAGFRAAGPTAYFHGGLSPQEILLPVLCVTPRHRPGVGTVARFTWEVRPGSARITARFLSVQILGRSEGLFTGDWPHIRVELRTENRVCSTMVGAAYGFDESVRVVSLRAAQNDDAVSDPNTIALSLAANCPRQGTVSVHLIDADSDIELSRLDGVEVALAL